MALSVECPECFQTYTVPEKLEGKRIKCKSCSAPILVRDPDLASSSLPPRASSSKPPRSKPSAGRKKKKKKRSQRSGGATFSLSAIDSPTGYLIIAIVIMTLWFLNMPTGKDSGVINGFLAIIVLALGSRMKYLTRRGEGTLVTFLLVTAIFVGICVFLYKIRKDIEADQQNGGQTAQNQESDEKAYPVPIPRDLALPAGTKLLSDITGAKTAVVIEDSNVGDEDVRIRFDEHPNREISQSRKDLMISSQVLQRLREQHKAAFDPVAANRASIAQTQQEKMGHPPSPNLVLIPVGFPVRDGVELYHHYEIRDDWYEAIALFSTEDYVKIQYLDNGADSAFQAGTERTVERSKLYIDRATVKASRSNPVQ